MIIFIILALKQINVIKDVLSKYDNNFQLLDKKINELIDKEIETVKSDMIKISDELKTLKESMGDLLDRLNENKTQIDDILDSLKDKKNNFNKGGISSGSRSARKEGDDSGQIEQMQEGIEDLKRYIDNRLLEINIKLEMISSSSNPNIEKLDNNADLDYNKKIQNEKALKKLKTFSPNKFELNSGNSAGISQLMKKIEDIDKNNLELKLTFKRFSSSFNANNVLDDIAKLKDAKADKADIPDQDSYNYLLDDIRAKIKKIESDIKTLTQRSDNFFSKKLSQQRDEQNANTVNKDMLKIFLTKEEYYKHLKPIELDLLNIKNDFQKEKEYLSQIMTSIKKKAGLDDLASTKEILIEKIEELTKACNIKFADKNECLRNFKHIEEQLKKILFILQKRNEPNSEGNDNWLIAKKPINGYSCAACESFIGELNNDVKKYVPWNRLPIKDSSDNYRMGIGYSKMLQMINFDNNGNINISPDINNDDMNTMFSDVTNGTKIVSSMGRTFYVKQKNIPSKTPSKTRVQSAMDVLNERKNELNIKKNNYLEENKNNNGLNPKTRNQKGLPKINLLEGNSLNQKDPKITKIVKKSQSKTNFRLKGTKI